MDMEEGGIGPDRRGRGVDMGARLQRAQRGDGGDYAQAEADFAEAITP